LGVYGVNQENPGPKTFPLDSFWVVFVQCSFLKSRFFYSVYPYNISTRNDQKKSAEL